MILFKEWNRGMRNLLKSCNIKNLKLRKLCKFNKF